MKIIIACVLLVLSLNVFAKNRKIAIVVGNSEYNSPFSNPVTTMNNALAIKEELEFLGYKPKDIKFLENATLAQIKQAIVEIPSRLDASDEFFFYYSGHGAQSGAVNFLIPVDGGRELDTYFSVNELLEKIDNDARKIIILDSCSSPTRASTEEMSNLDRFPFNTFLAISSSPGQAASEVNNDTKPDADIHNLPHSAFTKNLVRQMRKKEISLSEAFDKVRAAVLVTTKQKQTPIVKSNTIETLFFRSSRPEYVSPPLSLDMVISEAQFIANKYIANQSDENLEKLYALFSFDNLIWNGTRKTKETYIKETENLRASWKIREYEIFPAKVDEDSIDSDHKNVVVYINYFFEFSPGSKDQRKIRDKKEIKGCSRNKITLRWIEGKYLIVRFNEDVSSNKISSMCKIGKNDN